MAARQLPRSGLTDESWPTAVDGFNYGRLSGELFVDGRIASGRHASLHVFHQFSGSLLGFTALY